MKELRQVPEGDAGPPAALVSRYDRYIGLIAFADLIEQNIDRFALRHRVDSVVEPTVGHLSP